jgi:hypothetical protein
MSEGGFMNYIERKEQILDILKSSSGICSIDTLVKKLYVSKSTLRRDLIALEEEGIIIRYHGGIRLISKSSMENSIMMRYMENQDKKLAISISARSFLHDDMVIFLDSSSTVSYLLPTMSDLKNITIITNGLNIATQVNNNKEINCYICPGLLKQRSLSVIGEHTIEFLSNFHADIAFFSCKALNEDGVFEGDDSQALCKKAMFKNSDKTILLADSSKEHATGFFKLMDYSEVDIMISDNDFSPKLKEMIAAKGCKVLC